MCCQFLCILPGKFILIPFPAHPQQVSSFFRHPSSQRRAVFMSKRQELPWYGGVPPPRPFSPRHETWVPTWIKRPPTWDMGTYPLPLLPASDIWWSSLETCSNLFTAGPPSPTGTDIWWWPLKQVRLASGLYAPTGILSCYCPQTKFGAR